ncbi:alpha/beta fold hydrolase [Asanoa sp. WMMD1127]|uniref:alpha/beta fold hydrolase n=1 Tax=Asanoa sp. WMMD1127 TaxID=3016107 RepID=UPI0024161B11|nr:alpha/beta fold hydrolase [Asanoa sp. WMMD1127]MDG4826171.1 alpha/beta fold hydrolase [Asanoa sp. WMMD1127]
MTVVSTYHRAFPGPAGAPPVVLVHGLAVSHRYLLPLAAALADRHPAFVVDLPGFGRSGKPAHALDVGAHAAHLLAWLAARGLDRACLLGHSFGAEVVAAAAARDPRRVGAVVLASPTSDPAARSRSRQIGRWLRDVPREELWQVPVFVRDVRDAGPVRIFRTLGHSVHNAIEDDAARLRVPVLVVRGARDPVVPRAWAERLGPTVTVPGAPHNVVATAPGAVADAVAGFLSPAQPAAAAATLR